MNLKIIIGLLALIFAIIVVMIVSNRPVTTVETETHHDSPVVNYEIYPGKVAEKIERGEDFVLLDVRTPEEHEEIHIENSLLLPVDEISQTTLANIGLGEAMKDREIVLYCRSGNRSKRAYDLMTALGYTNLKSVQGGMVHWQEDNYPFTETGPYEGVSYVSTSSDEITDGPTISFDRTTHNFGQIPRLGGTVSTEFTITNSGTKTLELGDITTSCGCTSAEPLTTELAPGASTTLTVVFDPNFHDEPQGELERTVFIPTNDPNTPEAEVTITVEIIE